MSFGVTVELPCVLRAFEVHSAEEVAEVEANGEFAVAKGLPDAEVDHAHSLRASLHVYSWADVHAAKLYRRASAFDSERVVHPQPP